MADSRERAIELETAAARLNEDFLFSLPNVCGVGVAYRVVGGERTDEICVSVSVRRKLPLRSLRGGAIPREVLGPNGEFVPTDVEEEGDLTPGADEGRYRPVQPGTMIQGGGTLGGWVIDSTDFTLALLTNNHVFGSFSTGPTGAGTVVTQPGSQDRIGFVKRYAPLYLGPDQNSVTVSAADAAIGGLNPDTRTSNLVRGTAGVTTPEGYDAIYETAVAQLGDRVLKRGWYTELTQNGEVIKTAETVNFPYPGGSARIANVFRVGSIDGAPFWLPGDSGSVVMRQAPGTMEATLPALGLLFGGWTDGTRAFCCDMGSVYAALNVTSVCSVRHIIRALFGG